MKVKIEVEIPDGKFCFCDNAGILCQFTDDGFCVLLQEESAVPFDADFNTLKHKNCPSLCIKKSKEVK